MMKPYTRKEWKEGHTEDSWLKHQKHKKWLIITILSFIDIILLFFLIGFNFHSI